MELPTVLVHHHKLAGTKHKTEIEKEGEKKSNLVAYLSSFNILGFVLNPSPYYQLPTT